MCTSPLYGHHLEIGLFRGALCAPSLLGGTPLLAALLFGALALGNLALALGLDRLDARALRGRDVAVLKQRKK
jgi:hypothetical protein